LTESHPLEAYAADQWLGTNIFPELLAAFVTPNLEVVTQLMTAVSADLKERTGDAAIQGYQADKQRVYDICVAIYHAIHTWDIHYANPPASFGGLGQRIRFADSICRYKLATCLDLTLLFASMMEQCGLHPVILLMANHAYIGCHLIRQHFQTVPMDDLQAIRKRVDLDEFLVLETTCVTENLSLADAEKRAKNDNLHQDAAFVCAIDIARARDSGIRPLPLLKSAEGIAFTPPDARPETLDEAESRELAESVDPATAEETRPADRVERWTRKLLDLSLRNRLLNVRDTKQVIPIISPDPSALEDKIAGDHPLTLNALANLLSAKDLQEIQQKGEDHLPEETLKLINKELEQKRLWSPLPESELKRRLKTLYRQGKIDIEEGGVNTIFLTVGLLEWKPSERDEKSYFAPILMIPVSLRQKSISEGISISRIDEETVINVTLLELLSHEFRLTVPGLDPLPTDESGVDVNKVLQLFRQAIKDLKGWEVHGETRLGLFSFGKFIMWNDLVNRIDALKNHPLVNHLITGGGLFDDGIEVFPPEEIGQRLELDKLFCPMSADSSQLTAVIYSELGKSFVLHGPPGTGKSQTITNIIAHNLALGRRVLFVSEKKAALDVVHRRLSQIGLRPFCLELHSNKAGKTEVLAQFSEALQVADTAEPQAWNETIAEMNRLRTELQAYITALHHLYPNGISAYTCFANLVNQEDNGEKNLITLVCLDQTREQYLQVRQTVEALAATYKSLSPAAREAMIDLTPADWTPTFERNLLDAIKPLSLTAQAVRKEFRALADQYGLNRLPCTRDTLTGLAHLADTLEKAGTLPAPYLAEGVIGSLDALQPFVDNAVALEALPASLPGIRLATAAELDYDGIEQRLDENKRKFFLTRFFANRSLVKELAALKNLGSPKLTVNELTRLLPLLREYQSRKREHDRHCPALAPTLPGLSGSETPNWPEQQKRLRQTAAIVTVVKALTGPDTVSRNHALAQLNRLAADGTFDRPDPAVARFRQSFKAFQSAAAETAPYSTRFPQEKSIDYLCSVTQGILDTASELRDGLLYLKDRREAADRGLAPLAEALQIGEIPVGEIMAAFDEAYYRRMLEEILEKSPDLTQFSGMTQNERIKKFCELDDRYITLSRKAVFAKLAARLPRRRSGPCPEGTELGTLKRECEKKSRQKPVRKLLEQIPTLLQTLKPCFLMSPLSVAQYLPTDHTSFDLVVFDEASQIPVWDAIGVIARAKQLVVVGDPKQMPPTNFFQKGDADDPDSGADDLQEDLESILDECIAAGVHSSYLNWHYRSRHESLITFSNRHYYENRLFTFPSARNGESLGVKFHFVEAGVYDRRSSRTNRKEAEALVDHLFARLADPELRKKSVGIVTFSMAQQNLIEDIVELRRAENPSYEAFFNEQADEPFFVKNLENVQGDERDVIFFSVGYAPDAEGKFAMNFGPLNRDGGERRLNVAITRAKEQIIVFSSIHAHQIDLARTQALGAAHLKAFIDFAEKGIKTALGGETASGSGPVEGIADVIGGFLEGKGYRVDRNVGSSGYKIDLAVVDPDHPDTYLLGIECDGASYAGQKTTRDREHIRSSVLQSLGWHTYRAWSMEWTYNRDRAEANLLKTLEAAKRGDIPKPAAKPEEPDPEPAAAPKRDDRNRHPVYACWKGKITKPQAAFYDFGTQPLLQKQIGQILEKEAPIQEELLRKRLVKAWGFNRPGSQIQSILDDLLLQGYTTTQDGAQRIFWAPGQDPATYTGYRRPGEDDARRAIDEIPWRELANAMREVLDDFQACETETLYRETVRLFGFSGLTAKMRDILEQARKSC
ncbi:MAG: DUF3320 domain-containing protein, partial [Kiritimatiellae bacterium]|nr:DUF3320 domain-containing protein [Kiritimatiellia bacterium]